MPEWVKHTVRAAPTSPSDFALRSGGGPARVIGVVPDQIVTEALVEEPTVRDGQVVADAERDLAKIAVVERHLGTGRIGLGLVRGFGLRDGALASTIAHDAHNIVVVGMYDDDMHHAVARLVELGGGIVVVSDGEVRAELPLPVAGLLSDRPLGEVVEASRACVEAARGLGCTLPSPFQSLAFLALSVIPSLKITDRGLVDVDASSSCRSRREDALRERVRRDDGRRAERERRRLAARRGRLRARRRRRRAARERRARRPRRRARHARARQHPPPPLPDADARAGAAGRPLHVAPRAVSGLGAHRRGGGVRGRAHRARRARAVGLHDRLRPPLRLPARAHGADRGGGAGGARARGADRRVARLDGPRRVGRRPSARRAGRGPRRRARGHRAAGGRAARAGPGRARPDRGRALLAVLGHGEADGGVGRPRAPARPAAPHAPGRDGRGGRVLPRALRLHAGRVPGAARLAGGRRLVRPLRPSLATTRCAASARPAPASRTARPRTCASARGSPRCATCSTRACASGWAWTAPPPTSEATSSSR